ncbi:MAG: YgaP-like transmembrane domain [Desulfobacterales bacterium]
MANYSHNESAQTGHQGGLSSGEVNVGDTERILSGIGGTAIAIYGLTRGSLGGLVATAVGAMLLHRGTTGYCPLYALGEIDTAEPEEEKAIEIVEVMTVRCPREEVYASWRALEKLPRFMHHLESVRQTDNGHSQWVACLPKGMGTIAWEAEITEDRPNEKIAWQSLADADVHNSGEVLFREAPGSRGTEVKVHIEYHPPAGKLGRVAAGFANPAFSRMIRADIRRFKSLMETGEIPTTKGQPTGA